MDNEATTTTTPETKKREMVQFTHYETKEVREVPVPDKLQQVSQAFIAAFMTDENHYQDLPWYRGVVATAKKEITDGNNGIAPGDILIKAFPKVRIEFVKKYLPEIAPKPKTAKEKKPAKLDMWEL